MKDEAGLQYNQNDEREIQPEYLLEEYLKRI